MHSPWARSSSTGGSAGRTATPQGLCVKGPHEVPPLDIPLCSVFCLFSGGKHIGIGTPTCAQGQGSAEPHSGHPKGLIPKHTEPRESMHAVLPARKEHVNKYLTFKTNKGV